ncbi:MAG: hypothetical protein HY286_09775 [Planctomycetes bacterium]|nr:hypothetical protein [Planctomycetota bacterium]
MIATLAVFAVLQSPPPAAADIRAVPDLINEVCIAPAGNGAASAGGQFVEIYKTTAGNIGGYQLRDHKGNPLFTFPDMFVPAGAKCVVFLRPVPDVPSGFSLTLQNGSVAFSSNDLPDGDDYLDHHEGGVQLLDNLKNPRIADAVYWSDSGAAPAESMPGARGPAGFMDLSFSSGHPLGRDGGIGRAASPVDHYTSTAADFYIHGGRNAFGATPGRDNSAGAFTPAELAEDAQSLVMAAILRYASGAAPGWLQMKDARLDILNVLRAPSSMNIATQQEFSLADASIGNITLRGNVSVHYRWSANASAQSYTKTIQGKVASEIGYGFSVQIVESTSGFDDDARTTQIFTKLIFNIADLEFPVELRETSTRRRTSAESWKIESSASIRDFTNKPERRSRGVASITEMPGGSIQTVWNVTRDAPFDAPLPDSNETRASSTESISIIANERMRNADGERFVEITDFSYQQNGASIFVMDRGARGFADLRRPDSGEISQFGTRAGEFDMQFRIPGWFGAEGANRSLAGALEWATGLARLQTDGPNAEKWMTRGIAYFNSGFYEQSFAFNPSPAAGRMPSQSPSASRVPRVDFTTALGALATVAELEGSPLPNGAAEAMYAGVHALLQNAGLAIIRLENDTEIRRDLKVSPK